MILAAITISGVGYAILLVVGIILALIAFGHWISYGGLLGWWMANDMLELIGMLFKALVECIASMRD